MFPKTSDDQYKITCRILKVRFCRSRLTFLIGDYRAEILNPMYFICSSRLLHIHPGYTAVRCYLIFTALCLKTQRAWRLFIDCKGEVNFCLSSDYHFSHNRHMYYLTQPWPQTCDRSARKRMPIRMTSRWTSYATIDHQMSTFGLAQRVTAGTS